MKKLLYTLFQRATSYLSVAILVQLLFVGLSTAHGDPIPDVKETPETTAASSIFIIVTGRVTSSSDGQGIPGVNILVKGTATGTVTDIDGNYSIDTPNEENILVFSSIGYATQEIALNGRTVVDVVMEEDMQGLDEVVVTGYSTQRKKDITGSVSVVDIDALSSIPSGSADRALQGMASGVNVINSGIPGAAPKILVRGVTSFGNTDPLVIIDGIAGSLNTINASEIESIQVLKDAGAASIYGVRGANGVIVVTTKKGRTGAPVFSYEGSYGTTYPLTGNPFNGLSSEDWFKVFAVAYPGSDLLSLNGQIPDYVFRGPSGAGVAMEGDPRVDPSLYHQDLRNVGQNYIIQKLNKTNDGGDWWDWTFNKAPSHIHNISFSGGTEKTKYLFGAGITDQRGTMVESFNKMYSARVNTEFQLRDNIRVGENLSVMHVSRPSTSDGTTTAAWRMTPIVPLYDIMGNWGGTWGGPDLGVNSNQVAVTTRNLQDDRNYDWIIRGNAFAELDFLKNFTARTSIGYNITNSYDHNFTANQPENLEQSSIDNRLDVSAGYGSTMTWTNTLNYTNIFGDHDVILLVGSEAIETTNRTVSGGSGRFFSTDLSFQTLDNGTIGISNNSSIGKSALFSLFSRVDYTFDSRYLLSATLRRDGSSVFGPERRFGFFPSVSVGWRVTEEAFMQDITWLNDLKVRGSYGILGSQNNVASTNAFSLYGSGLGTTYYDITGASTSTVLGFARSRIGNLFTGWEENIVSNFGFDATVLDYNLEISAEYFKKSINGLLFTEPLPAVIIGGATAPTINIGDIQNTGVDGSIKYSNNVNNDLNFGVTLNVTTYKNLVVDIPDPGYFDSGSAYSMGSISRNQEGHPVSSFFGYKVISLFNSDEEVAAAPTQSGAQPGRFRYQDTDGDGAITPEDRIHLGDPNPDFTYGLNLNLDYKGVDLSAFFYGSQGNEAFQSLLVYTNFFSNYMEQKSNRLLDAWTPENTNTKVPKIETSSSFSTTQVANSYFVEDASYFRLKSLILGYTFQPALLERLGGITNLRIYAQAANLFTITKYSGVDPEIGGPTASFGIDNGRYPNNEKSLIFGLNVSF
jgi:TonB-linked SusC/RagA family outer membrane protein